MLNRSKAEAEDFIKTNSKKLGGTMTDKEIGLVIGCSGPRVCQIRKDMKGSAEVVEFLNSVETALAPEAA